MLYFPGGSCLETLLFCNHGCLIVEQRSEELGLFVISEEDDETLLVHRISSDDIYRKQEGIFLLK